MSLKEYQKAVNYLFDVMPDDCTIEYDADNDCIKVLDSKDKIRAIHAVTDLCRMADGVKLADVDPILDNNFNKSTKVNF